MVQPVTIDISHLLHLAASHESTSPRSPHTRKLLTDHWTNLIETAITHFNLALTCTQCHVVHHTSYRTSGALVDMLVLENEMRALKPVKIGDRQIANIERRFVEIMGKYEEALAQERREWSGLLACERYKGWRVVVERPRVREDGLVLWDPADIRGVSHAGQGRIRLVPKKGVEWGGGGGGRFGKHRRTWEEQLKSLTSFEGGLRGGLEEGWITWGPGEAAPKLGLERYDWGSHAESVMRFREADEAMPMVAAVGA